MKNIFFAFLPVLFCFEISQAQSYTVFQSSTGKEVAWETMTANLAANDVVFFGEQHDDSLTHVLQLQLLESLHSVIGGKLVLSMEMFESDGQMVLDEYLKGLITEDKLIKDARAWPKYATDYKPSVEFAKANKLKVIAANAPRRYVSMVSKGGLSALNSLSKPAKTYLAPLPIDTLTGRYREKFADIMGGAAHLSSGIYGAQSTWDATMAHFIHTALKEKGTKVIHYCGQFHSDEKLGTMAQLAMRSKKWKQSNVTVRKQEGSAKVEDHFFEADYVIWVK